MPGGFMRIISAEQSEYLSEMAYRIRRMSLEMITYGQWGHIGGAFSLAEILSVLYFCQMTVDPALPREENRDRLILSKAHASPALYAALALKGFFPEKRIYDYCEIGGLEGHTHTRGAPGVETSGGPLGMGLSVAVGMALGLRRKENPRPRVFCIMGDGELNEGNVWEAAMAASHYHLDNIIGIIDYNKVQAKGFVWEEMGIEPLADKWRSFGWNVLELDGHDIEALAEGLYRARWIEANGHPVCIVAHTVKGKGIERAEFNYKWHTHAPDPQTADDMLKELSRRYGRTIEGYSRINETVKKEVFYGGE
jgi:transketolase